MAAQAASDAAATGEVDVLSRMWDELVRAHNEVMDALPINMKVLEEAWDGPGVLDGVKSFIKAVDWSEPFFLYLLGFHVTLSFGAFAFSWGSSNRTAIAIMLLMGLVFLGQFLNSSVLPEYRSVLFVDQKVNYFDDQGLFMSAVYMAPLLILAVLLQLKLFYRLFVMMVKIKRLKLKSDRVVKSVKEMENTHRPDVVEAAPPKGSGAAGQSAKKPKTKKAQR